MEQPKKYIKVSVSDRLPELDETVTVILDSGESCVGCFITNDYWCSIEIQNKPDMPEFWLEEVPDRESELIDLIKECKNTLMDVDWVKYPNCQITYEKIDKYLELK